MSVEAKRDEFVKLVREYEEQDCIEYIAKHDGFYNAVLDYDYGDVCKSDMLQMVCMRGLNRVAIALINKKCDLIYQDMDGWSAIMCASYKGLHDVVKLLIDNITDHTTRISFTGLSEIMHVCISNDVDNTLKMIDCGYDIYYKSNINNTCYQSLFTVAIYHEVEKIVYRLLDTDICFADEFNILYHNPTREKTEIYNNIMKYCQNIRNTYKQRIIATINDASSGNTLHYAFRNIYAIELVDIICDFIILKT